VTTAPARSRSASSGAKAETSPGAVDLALGQHRAGGVLHRGQQVDLPAVWSASGAAQGLAIDRDRPPSMLLAWVVTGGEPAANHPGQGLGVKPAQGPADGGLGGDGPVAAERVAAGAERGPDRLGCLRGPFGDRGDRPRTRQDRGSRQSQDGDQWVAAPGAGPGVGDGGQGGQQVRWFGRPQRTDIAERGQPRRDRG
jgi:hypothetical protein